jgi:hypothetical protein
MPVGFQVQHSINITAVTNDPYLYHRESYIPSYYVGIKSADCVSPPLAYRSAEIVVLYRLSVNSFNDSSTRAVPCNVMNCSGLVTSGFVDTIFNLGLGNYLEVIIVGRKLSIIRLVPATCFGKKGMFCEFLHDDGRRR